MIKKTQHGWQKNDISQPVLSFFNSNFFQFQNIFTARMNKICILNCRLGYRSSLIWARLIYKGGGIILGCSHDLEAPPEDFQVPLKPGGSTFESWKWSSQSRVFGFQWHPKDLSTSRTKVISLRKAREQRHASLPVLFALYFFLKFARRAQGHVCILLSLLLYHMCPQSWNKF